MIGQMSHCMQHSCSHLQLRGPAQQTARRHGCCNRSQAFRPLGVVTAKRSLQQEAEKQTAEAPKGDPRDRFTGYEPVDSEGNPWWDPPNRDIFEGGAWEWLGKGAQFVIPTLLAFAVASGTFAAANYIRGPAPPEPAPSETQSAPKGDSLDYLLQSDDSNAPLAPF